MDRMGQLEAEIARLEGDVRILRRTAGAARTELAMVQTAGTIISPRQSSVIAAMVAEVKAALKVTEPREGK